MPDAFLGYSLATGALLLFTTGILVAKVASSHLKLGLGFLIATTTNVVFSLLAFTVQLLIRPEALRWNAYAFWLFAIAGGFATYLGRWFFYESVVRFGPAKASVFQVSSPLFTALIAWLLLGEDISLLVGLGMVMTICGLMLVSCKPGFFSRTRHTRRERQEEPSVQALPRASLHQRLLGSVLLLGLGSSLAYAIGNVLRGTAVRVWNEPIFGALVGAAFGLALHLIFSSGKRQMVQVLKAASRRGIGLYALLGVCTISAQICVIASMRYIPLSVATLVTLCTPILVFPLNHLLFRNDEAITALMLLGGALTMAGIAIIVLR
ncbi:MAG: protein of unknown function transrane [Polaromonas sp.]|nr:protein of unknown function transrane [Polaromonas sp.]